MFRTKNTKLVGPKTQSYAILTFVFVLYIMVTFPLTDVTFPYNEQYAEQYVNFLLCLCN